MAYNPYYQYPGYNYGPFQQTAPVQSQTQSNGFISVRGFEEAFNWPIAPGNSLTFKDETAPYIYTKTKGFSQLEPPIVERFRLVKEDPQDVTQKPAAAFDAEEQINSLWAEVNALKSRFEASTGKRTKSKKDEEGATNDANE